MQKHHKAITLALAVFWLFGMAAYSSSLIGTLFHELSHKSDAVGIKAIEVRYDSSGLATADCFHGETEHRKFIYYSFYEIIIILMAGRGTAGHGGAGRGTAWRGKARQGFYHS